MTLPIITEPNPLLRTRAAEVPVAEITTPGFQTLIDDMIETMYAANGIGIAGPQIGQLRRVIIIETGDRKPVALVNPIITSHSWRTVESEEGCLSVPGIYGVVKRHRGVKATAYDRTGKEVRIKNSALVAIILQHEIDHLDGILFIDKAKKIQKINPDAAPKI